MRDLHPAQARLLLEQVVATLDAAEVLALRTYLPPAASRFLPGCAGEVATVMNRAPMPWELPEPPPPSPRPSRIGVETGELIRTALPSTSRRRLRAAVLAAICAGAVVGGSLAWRLGVADEEPAASVSLVPLPQVTQYAPMSAPKIARGKKAAGKSAARKSTATVARSQASDWASPFERRE